MSRTEIGCGVVQGPPGTGKTTVILSILNFLHLTEYQRHYDAIIQQVRELLFANTARVCMHVMALAMDAVLLFMETTLT